MISSQTAKIYFSSTKRRRYLSLSAAVNAEAVALILQKYPTESPEYEDGMMYYPGSHWSQLPRSNVMLRRMKRVVLRAYKQQETRHAVD